MKHSTLFLLVLLATGGCSPTPMISLRDREAAHQKLEQLLTDEEPAALNSRIDEVLRDGLIARRLSSEQNAAWQIMHGVLTYGTELKIDTPDRGYVGAVEYAFTGGQIQGFELMAGSELLPSTGRHGMKARLEPGSYVGQGHVDQWLAIFAMAELPPEMKVQVGDREFTILDWARQAQYDASNNLLDEFSWTLIALTHYFPDEAAWQGADGLTLSWELLVEAELMYDLDLSPCGGTHRLAGLVRAVHAKERLGLADSPIWDQAKRLIENCLISAKVNRGTDGSLSSYYFERPGTTADLSGVLASSGHVLEFIALAAPQEELSAPWVELPVTRVCEMLESTRDMELDCGALYHALNGLKILRQRRM